MGGRHHIRRRPPKHAITSRRSDRRRFDVSLKNQYKGDGGAHDTSRDVLLFKRGGVPSTKASSQYEKTATHPKWKGTQAALESLENPHGRQVKTDQLRLRGPSGKKESRGSDGVER